MVRHSNQAKKSKIENVPPKPRKRKGPRAPKSINGGKKVRRETPAAALSQLTLMDLPEEIHRLLLKYLDVRTLKTLAMTNHHLHEMICGRYLLMLPEGVFNTIQKKPLLRIELKKPMTNNHMLLLTQLDLLRLQNLRELDLGTRIPANWTALAPAVRADINWTWSATALMDKYILNRLSGLGALQNLSRLDVFIPDDSFAKYSFAKYSFAKYLWEEIIPKVKLLSLRLTVVEGSTNR